MFSQARGYKYGRQNKEEDDDDDYDDYMNGAAGGGGFYGYGGGSSEGAGFYGYGAGCDGECDHRLADSLFLLIHGSSFRGVLAIVLTFTYVK